MLNSTVYHEMLSIQNFMHSFNYIPIGIILIIFLLGSLCNLLAIATFCQPNTREMGSGIYRLWISIIGQLGITIVVIHLIIEKNGSGKIGCFVLEYLREVFHALYDSLTACTMLERTMVIYQGITFNKNRSRQIAKLIIAVLIFYHFIIIIYEPFYRQLIYSIDRYFCTIKFPNQFLLKFQNIITLCHFIVPYFINLISPIIWVIALTKNKSILNKNISIWMNLKNVSLNYMYTIIACYTLVLFNTPKVIVTFCLTFVKLQWQHMAFIIVHFLSLVPLMINLFIFVLPSPKYRPEFFHLIQRIIRYKFRSQYTPT